MVIKTRDRGSEYILKLMRIHSTSHIFIFFQLQQLRLDATRAEQLRLREVQLRIPGKSGQRLQRQHWRWVYFYLFFICNPSKNFLLVRNGLIHFFLGVAFSFADRIRDPVPFWPLDLGSGMGKKSGAGSGMKNPDHNFRELGNSSAFYFLKLHLHHFSKIKDKKQSQNSRNQGFSYYFCMMIEGSGSGSRVGSGSGSIPLTSGSWSVSGRPKNMWIRWIRIRIRIRIRNTA